MSTPPRNQDIQSPASRTAEPDRQTNNATLAANLATSLPTGNPNRACANSGRKRRHAPNLSRMYPSPSREERVSTLFQSLAPNLPLSNTRKPRRPLAEARHTRFGEHDAENTRGPYSYRSPPKVPNARESPDAETSTRPNDQVSDDGNARKKPLRRVLSPSAWHAADSTVDPSLEPGLAGLSSAADRANSSEEHESYQDNIEAWLHGTQQRSPHPEPGTSGSPSSTTETSTSPSPITYPNLATNRGHPHKPRPEDSSSSSDKENVSPTSSSTPTPSPSRAPLTWLPTSTPSRFRHTAAKSSPKPILSHSPPRRAVLSALPSTPKGHLAAPPRRKRANDIVGGKPPAIASTSSSGLPFTIYEDSAGGLGAPPPSPAAPPPPPPATFTAPEDFRPIIAVSGPAAGGSDVPTSASAGTGTGSGTGDFTVSRKGSVLMDALVGLSPSVEVRRKGRKGREGMRGKRCTSYWDEDVLPGMVDEPQKGDGGVDESEEDKRKRDVGGA